MLFITNKAKISLITGASGFLGKYIFNDLKSRGYNIVILAREATYATNQIQCNLAKEIPRFDQLGRLDIVVHAAGKAHFVPKTTAENQEFWDVNLKGTQNLLKALEQLAEMPKSFVFISTVAVYGCEEGEMINESHPLEAKNPYGLSKIQAENLVQEWCAKHAVKGAILRLPLVAGQNPPGNLGAMINAMRKGYYFRIGDSHARRSWVWATDVAQIIPKAAETAGIYNLTDGYHPTLKEIEECFADILDNQRVRQIPIAMAKALARGGDFLNAIGWKSFPFSSYRLHKMTTSLTFSDEKSRQALGWNPVVITRQFREVFSK